MECRGREYKEGSFLSTPSRRHGRSQILSDTVGGTVSCEYGIFSERGGWE